MPVSPYDGLEEADLLEIKAGLLKILKLKSFTSQNVPGLNYTRRIDSLAEARSELALVNSALDNLAGVDSAFTDRTYIKAV